MKKFHNTPEGPKDCRATVRHCTYGNGEHFDSFEAAQAAYEQGLSEELGGAAPDGLKKGVQGKEAAQLSALVRETSFAEADRGSELLKATRLLEERFAAEEDPVRKAQLGTRLAANLNQLSSVLPPRDGAPESQDKQRAYTTVKDHYRRTYNQSLTKAQAVRTFTKRLAELAPDLPQDAQEAFSTLSEKPTLTNLRGFQKAMEKSRVVPTAEQKQVRAALASFDTYTKQGLHDAVQVETAVLPLETSRAMREVYPTMKGEAKPLADTPKPDNCREYPRIPGLYVPEGGKSDALKGPVVVGKTEDGWATFTSQGYPLWGPFASSDEAVEAAQVRQHKSEVFMD